MKQIINGKMYNTETAKCVGEYWNGLSGNDFNNLQEDLFKKKTGEFFLRGIGGALTRYSRSCGNNSYCGGKKIIPLTIAEAKSWAEEYMDTEEYETIFGEVAE